MSNLGNFIGTYYIVSTKSNKCGCFPNSTMALCYAPTAINPIQVNIGSSTNLVANGFGLIMANKFDSSIPSNLLQYYKFNIYQDCSYNTYIIPYSTDNPTGGTNQKLLSLNDFGDNMYNIRFFLDFHANTTDISWWNQWLITRKYMSSTDLNDPYAFQILLSNRSNQFSLVHVPNINGSCNGTTYTSYSLATNLAALNNIGGINTSLFSNDSCICGLGNVPNANLPPGTWYLINCSDNTYATLNSRDPSSCEGCQILNISTVRIPTSNGYPSTTTIPTTIPATTIPATTISATTIPATTIPVKLTTEEYEIGGGLSLFSIASLTTSSSISLSLSFVSSIFMLLILGIFVMKKKKS